jgi:hypothetical protein
VLHRPFEPAELIRHVERKPQQNDGLEGAGGL